MLLEDYINSGIKIPTIRRRSKEEAPRFLAYPGGREALLFNCLIVSYIAGGCTQYSLLYTDTNYDSRYDTIDSLTGMYKRNTSLEALTHLYELWEAPTTAKTIGKFRIKNRK